MEYAHLVSPMTATRASSPATTTSSTRSCEIRRATSRSTASWRAPLAAPSSSSAAEPDARCCRSPGPVSPVWASMPHRRCWRAAPEVAAPESRALRGAHGAAGAARTPLSPGDLPFSRLLASAGRGLPACGPGRRAPPSGAGRNLRPRRLRSQAGAHRPPGGNQSIWPPPFRMPVARFDAGTRSGATQPAR